MQLPIPLVLALLAVPALSPAQTAPDSPVAVVDPTTAVPAPAYRSALPRGGVVQDSIDWKAANAEVGRYTRGHMDILKWEQSQGSAPSAKPQPATPMPGGAMPMHRHH